GQVIRKEAIQIPNHELRCCRLWIIHWTGNERCTPEESGQRHVQVSTI
ncbi:hypothetical protein ACZ87_03213, partial [Candidatus Erwinia dacicola]